MLMVTVVAVTLAGNTNAVVIPSAFMRWQQLAKDTKSLAVEFTMTTKDSATGRVAAFDATFRLLRTDTDTLAKLVMRNRATKEMLVQTLQDFEGTMLFVSHDRTFLKGLATHVLDLSGNGGRGPLLFQHSYTDWVERTGHEAPGVHA